MPRPARILGLGEVVEHLAEVVIQLLDHGTVERIGLSDLQPFLRVFRKIDSQFFDVLVEQGTAAGMDGGVDQKGAVIKKEGLVLVLPDKGQCILAVLMAGEPVVVQPEGVVFFAGGKPGHSVWFHRFLDAMVLTAPVKTDLGRLGFRGFSEVPFSTMPGDIAIFSQSLGKVDHLGR